MAKTPTSPPARVLYRVLYDATRALPRHRMRTRLSILTEAHRLLASEEHGTASADAGTDTLNAELDRMIEARHLDVGGPTQKRLQLNAAGKAHARDVLRLT